ncbi:MAG: DUF2835 domain-containing protein [Pseudomonadota bacterium]
MSCLCVFSPSVPLMPSPPPQKIRFRLAIPADAYAAYYRGAIKAVSVTACDGRRIQFPVNLIHKFLGHDGIHGTFEILFDENQKCLGIARID